MHIANSKIQEILATKFKPGNWVVEPFGSGRFSNTFRIIQDNETYIMRIAPPDDMLQLFYEYRMMRQEPRIHKIIYEQTCIPVPQIIYHDFSRDMINRDYLIMPVIPGMPLSDSGLNATGQQKALKQWGGYVQQLHEITDPSNHFGYLGEHQCMEPQSTWTDAFYIMYQKELEDIKQTGIYEQATVDYALNLLHKNLHCFENDVKSHLCHGDLWTANLLVNENGEVTGLIDFDRACWGDIEWDLAIADYCGITQPAFWEGYGRKIDRTTGDAAIRKLFYTLYEHQKYIVISMSRRRNNPSGAKRYASQCLAIMKRFEKTGMPEL